MYNNESVRAGFQSVHISTHEVGRTGTDVSHNDFMAMANCSE